jgi:Carboxypeptidase regulatory-like domain
VTPFLIRQSVLLLFAISTGTAQVATALNSVPALGLPELTNSAQPGSTTAGMMAQSQNQKSDCAVEGTVINIATGEPIARAQVALMGPGVGAGTMADSSGRWSLTNLSCGSVQLMATRPGFVPNLRKPGTAGGGKSLVLSSGSPIRDMKLELIPQAAIFGKVTDEQGDPVQGAQIQAFTSRVIEGQREMQPSGGASTNDLGEYRAANLMPGKYIVCVHANPTFSSSPVQGGQMIYNESCYPGPIEGGAANGADVPAGRETRIDFTLTQIPGVHIRGVLSGVPQGQGMTVSLMKRSGKVLLTSNYGASVGPDGKFDITAVAPGSYFLQANCSNKGTRLWARLPIEVGSANIDGVALQLEPGATVKGVVRYESQSGQTAQKPNRIKVALRSSDPMSHTGRLKWDNDHVSFTISDVMPGTYRVETFVPAPFYVKSVVLNGQDVSGQEISINQPAGLIELVLSNGTGVLEGNVKSADGHPVESGIMLIPQRGRPRTASCGADGHFKIPNVPPGEYKVYAFDDTSQVEYAEPGWIRQYGAAGVSVTVRTGESAQVELVQQLVLSQ